MSINTLLEGEIETRLKELNGMDSGTEEYKAKRAEVTQLMDRKIEMDKLDVEHDLKMRQLKEDKTSRWTRDITNWANLTIGAGMFIWGFIASTNFEREGTFTTSAGRHSAKKVLSWFK